MSGVINFLCNENDFHSCFMTYDMCTLLSAYIDKCKNYSLVAEGYILYKKITHYKISLNLPDHKPLYSNQIANKRT